MTAARSFRWVRGRDRITVFELPSGFLHAFCRVCGSPMPGPDAHGKVVPLPAGCLDDDPETRPFRHAFVASKAPWYEITDDLAQFETWAAGEVTGDPRQIVSAGYDACAPSYNAQREPDAGPELKRLIDLLEADARILDIGCGGGVPVTLALSRRGSVVGIDISAVQVEQARRQVPNATFVHGDISSQAFEASSFDAIVAYYALFHIPREEQGPLLERIASWLRPSGYLLATLATSSHPGYTEANFFGTTMYWSHFERDWYTDALRDLGFEILASETRGHGYRDEPGRPAESHPVVLARLSTERSPGG
jgi:SAM-dependent methyltransferase